jgi:hypothetical protein
VEHAGDVPDQGWYFRHVFPGLQRFSLTTIARATGMSTSAEARARSGTIPHLRHWNALEPSLSSRRIDCLHEVRPALDPPRPGARLPPRLVPSWASARSPAQALSAHVTARGLGARLEGFEPPTF